MSFQSSLPNLDESKSKQLKINEQCFIRKGHKCGKMFGASKSCFIACPSDDGIEMTLELISEKLSKAGIEAIIAVNERAYGQDIFCTKICGKIIESRFCLVLLDDSIIKNKNIPNPNVYYEYGLMTALQKHIIPLQKDDLKLAFNIQSYDTIKYKSQNIGIELDRAIKDAIKITEAKNILDKKQILSNKSLLRKFELANFKIKNESWFLSNLIDDTDFKGFGHHKHGFYLYLGKLDEQKEFQTYLDDLNIVLYRTEEQYKELNHEMEKIGKNSHQAYIVDAIENDNYIKSVMDDRKEKRDLMSTIYIAFIINPELESSHFLKNAKNIISKYDRFKLVCEKNNIMDFGVLKVDLSQSLNI